MPKMTHWNSPEPIQVSPEKAAVYAAQGWQVQSGAAAKKTAPAITAMTTASVDEPAPAPVVEEPAEPVKKAPAKRAAKKAAKKS